MIEREEMTGDSFRRVIELLNAEPIEESDFCEGQRVEPAELESYLHNFFRRHDPQEVLVGRDLVPAPALILVAQYKDAFTFRVFSIADEKTRESAQAALEGGRSSAQQ